MGCVQAIVFPSPMSESVAHVQHDQQLRILIVGQYFWPESFRINEVAATLSKLGHQISILTGQPNYPSGKIYPGYRAWRVSKESYEGMTVFRVPLIPRGRAGALSLLANYLSFVANGVIFAPLLLRREKFDVIFVYAPSPIFQVVPAIVLRRIFRCTLVTWVQDLWPESLRVTGYVTNHKLLAIVRFMVRWIYRQNDLLLAQSHAFVREISADCGSIPVIYHPNPGELAFLDSQGGSQSELRLGDGFNVLFAGNLGVAQALETILGAANKLRSHSDIRMVFVGSGSRSAWLVEEVRRMGLTNVLIAGRYPPEDMPSIFKQADVLLVSLAKDPVIAQTVPSKISAYLASGRPIIAALDGEGAHVVAEAQAGIVCGAEDVDGLAGAVLRMRSLAKAEREEMARSGRAYYEQHFEPLMLARRLAKILVDQVSRTSAKSAESKHVG